MRFRLTIESDDAALTDDPFGSVADILRNVARRVDHGNEHRSGNVRDVNGNAVGRFELDITLTDPAEDPGNYVAHGDAVTLCLPCDDGDHQSCYGGACECVPCILSDD